MGIHLQKGPYHVKLSCLIFKLAPVETVTLMLIRIRASIFFPRLVGIMQLIIVVVVCNGEKLVLNHAIIVSLPQQQPPPPQLHQQVNN